MALPATNLDNSAIKSALGETSNALSVLATSACVNLYAHYSPTTICADAGNKCFTCFSDVADYNQGDFRCYEHTAGTPCVCNTTNFQFTCNTPDCFGIPIFNCQINVKAAASGICNYVTKVWIDNTCTSLICCSASAMTFVGITPPAGHKKNQVECVTVFEVNCVTITSPATYDGCTLYAETYLADASNCYRYPTFETDVCVHQLQDPCILSFQTQVPIPAGWTAAFLCKGADNHVNGQTCWNFTACAEGFDGSCTAEICACVDLCYTFDGCCFLIECCKFYSGGFKTTSVALGGSDVLNYDDECTINAHFICILGFVP